MTERDNLIMAIFERLDKIEQTVFNIDHAASMITLVAEDLSLNDEASALWGVNNLLKMTTEKIEQDTSILYSLLREYHSLKIKPAPKKRGRPRKEK